MRVTLGNKRRRILKQVYRGQVEELLNSLHGLTRAEGEQILRESGVLSMRDFLYGTDRLATNAIYSAYGFIALPGKDAAGDDVVRMWRKLLLDANQLDDKQQRSKVRLDQQAKVVNRERKTLSTITSQQLPLVFVVEAAV